MTQPHYAIMRFAKYKGPEISNIEAHNERRKENYASNPDIDLSRSKYNFHLIEAPGRRRAAENGEHEKTDYRLKGVLPMADNKQHDTRTARRPDCVTEIRMGNSVLVVSGYFKKDTTTTAADKMARVLEAEAAATQEPTYPA